MTKTNPLTRKAGPLPVWAWAALVLVAGYVYVNRAATASGGTQLPFTPSGTSAAQRPASGQGSPADNGNSDLLDALGSNLASSDALLAALQAGGQGGGYGASGGTGMGGTSGGGTDTATVTAATVDSGTNNAPVDSYSSQPMFPVVDSQATAYSSSAPVSYRNPDGTWSNFEGALPGWTSMSTATPYAANVDAASTPNPTYSTPSALTLTPQRELAVTAPTSIVVQPAPVDTSGVIVPTPRPTVGHNVAV